jgi:hypothetical protein
MNPPDQAATKDCGGVWPWPNGVLSTAKNQRSTSEPAAIVKTSGGKPQESNAVVDAEARKLATS